MSEELKFILRPAPHPSRQNALAAVKCADDEMVIMIKQPTRTLAQNALMWATLKQLEPIDWYGYHLTKEEWKDVITSSLKRLKVVPGIDGGFVVCGASTSRMSIKAMDDVIEAAYALGSSKGIKFIDTATRGPR